MQVVGKIRLECAPWVNHSWGSTLYVASRGLTTSPMPGSGRTIAIDFDFVGHTLRISTSGGNERSFDLEPMSVADFYRKTMDALHDLDIKVAIFFRPVEIEEAIPFAEDTKHASYDTGAVHRCWTALVQANRVFSDFRARFISKASAAQFFWGAFGLAVARFSGRRAPKYPGGAPNCADEVMEEAYSHKMSSAGFWPGAGPGEAAFYSYADPEPPSFRQCTIRPQAAYFHEGLGEFILPYAAVRAAMDPDATLLAFQQSTYEAAADLAEWDRDALEYPGASHGPQHLRGRYFQEPLD